MTFVENSTQEAEIDLKFRQAWKLPDRLKPSQWAERHRVLTAAESAEPGAWDNNRTPYLVGIMDAICEPGVEEITFVKPTQVGGSELLRNLLGYWIEEDPGPCLYVMPTEQAVKEAFEERLKPLILNNPSVRRHWSGDPHDLTQTRITLDTMSIYFAWAGSPQSLATRPCRYVLLDEVDKFPAFAGREADPISLAVERTATYGHRRRVVKVSTCTTREGLIWRSYEDSGDRRQWEVDCPMCGQSQQLAWQQVRWDKDDSIEKKKLADKIDRDKSARFECASCKAQLLNHHKPKMLRTGRWVTVGEKSKKVSFRYTAVGSPWRSFSEAAGQFIRADGDPGATMNFRNSWLAEPFETQISKREPSAIRAKADYAATLGMAGQVRIVPAWAVILLATCDVQKDHCYWQVDAWGYEMKSKRAAVGIAATLDEVFRQVFAPDVPFRSDGGGAVMVANLIVDSGYRKDEVTEFARKDPRRVQLAKGLSTYFGPIAELKVEKASGVMVWNINTMQSKDALDRLIGDPDPAKWQVFAGIGDEYAMQLSSEHKILDPQTKQMVWKQKTSAAPNHWWDCSAMSTAVASAMGANMPEAKAQPSQSSESSIPASEWMNRGKRW
jgi:phage terminase large subunit GpA-like protein